MMNLKHSKAGNGLAGTLLVAMPGMGDPRFSRAVIYMCAHDNNGAMGLVINNVMQGFSLETLLEQLDLDDQDSLARGALRQSVFSGGPVEQARGFLVHSADFRTGDTVTLDSEIGITGTLDALRTIAQGRGPEKSLLVLGYSGWSAGQLESEIQQNAWLTVTADQSIVFHENPDEKWLLAVRKLGVDPAMLSASAGRA